MSLVRKSKVTLETF